MELWIGDVSLEGIDFFYDKIGNLIVLVEVIYKKLVLEDDYVKRDGVREDNSILIRIKKSYYKHIQKIKVIEKDTDLVQKELFDWIDLEMV